MDYGILSILPSLISIILAMAFKNVLLAIISACLIANLIILDWNILLAMQETLNTVIKVFESNANTKIILSMILIGGLIHVIEKSGGVQGFVNLMTKKNGLIQNQRGALLFTWLIGISLFTTGILSVLVTGSISKPINKAMKVAPEKAAYVIHSVGSGWPILVPISVFGPFILGLIESTGAQNGTGILIQSITLNFYSILAVLGTLFLILIGKDFGPMKQVVEDTKMAMAGELALDEESEKAGKAEKAEKAGKATLLIIPMITMVLTIIAVMLITGNGSLIKGDGYSAILWGLLAGIVMIGVMCKKDKVYTYEQFLSELFKGCGTTLLIATILVLAFSLGGLIRELNTGIFLADVFMKFLSPSILPAMVFLLSCVMSFATGTSAGTLSIMAPLVLPMALSMNISMPLVVGAVCGGSIFGDQTSPISDSSIISASVTGCKVHDHVRTQLPYAAFFAEIATILYVIIGFIM